MKKYCKLVLVLVITILIGTSYVSAKNCTEYKGANKCRNAGCVWQSKYKFCSPNGLVYIACGSGSVKANCSSNKTNSGAYDIPVMIPELVSFAVNALKIVTPVILIIVGMIQMIKAITRQSEDEINKAQKGLIKKIGIAVMVFFVISIVQFAIGQVADVTEKSSFSNCLECFLNGPKSCQLKYYRDENNRCVSLSK